ncbi:unnamed protein product [Paramecium primaurelia]|uniref:Uncharacterized protein n=1 Tax=Paramecium primaurelia TaxID=5886 RepID=A0A8S1MPQ1_PARPR|nr:unnamed protein product [Paramecium primaurelia]
MGCNPSNISIHEPQVFLNQRKIGRNPKQLTDIQQNIDRHLKQQLGQSKTNASSPNTIITSTRSSRITEHQIDISKSTNIFLTDQASQPLQRRSLQ